MNGQSSTSETCRSSDGVGRSDEKDRSRPRKGGPSGLANGRVRAEGYVGAAGEENWLEEWTVFGRGDRLHPQDRATRRCAGCARAALAAVSQSASTAGTELALSPLPTAHAQPQLLP